MVGLGIFVFVLGLIVGSFLNVVIYRYNTGRSVARGRSICFSCGTVLRFFELIPVVSFLFQKGRCRSCGVRLSPQYVFVEIASGLLFLGSVFRYGVSWPGLFAIVVCSLLLVIAVYDFRHKIIPDGLVFLLAGLSLVFLAYQHGFAFSFLRDGAFFAGLGFFAFFALLWLVSRGSWMGFGDAKLVISFGWFLGLDQGLAALFLAFVLGAVVGTVLLLVRSRSFTMKHEIPFAPFLVAGFYIVMFTSVSMSWVLGNI